MFCVRDAAASVRSVEGSHVRKWEDTPWEKRFAFGEGPPPCSFYPRQMREVDWERHRRLSVGSVKVVPLVVCRLDFWECKVCIWKFIVNQSTRARSRPLLSHHPPFRPPCQATTEWRTSSVPHLRRALISGAIVIIVSGLHQHSRHCL